MKIQKDNKSWQSSKWEGVVHLSFQKLKLINFNVQKKTETNQ